MKNIVKVSLLVLGLLFSFSLTVNAKERSNVDIANGAEVWANTCMRCHNLRAPADLSIRAWSFSMNHMRVRAGLTGKESRDILAFILSSKTKKDRD